MGAGAPYTEIDGALELSTDPARLDRTLIHEFLSEQSYWATGVPRAVIERAIEHSLCFGVYRQGTQVAFARVVTDHATFAYLADVFVQPAYRGSGIAKWMLGTIVNHPDLQGLRRFILATRDAHGLYARFGFAPLANPGRFLERFAPDPYGAR
ncbi:MAG TPA: GNAT family N-acetyltransferase [Casimicrobiaceae bacterium]